MKNRQNQIIKEIAKSELEIITLEERGSDSLDFHQISVWELKDALNAAFQAGQNEAMNNDPLRNPQ